MKKTKNLYSHNLVLSIIFVIVVIVIDITVITSYLATLGYTLSVTVAKEKIEVSIINPDP